MLRVAVTREDLSFTVDGAECAGWLYRPGGDGRPQVPGVVMAHGFGMTRECRLDVWAEAFAAAGLAAFVFDYRFFGASGGQPRQLLDLVAQRRDWTAAVAALRATSGIDAGRIALWGTSFSGGHVLHVAARDRKIAAVVAQVPFTDGRSSLAGGGRPDRSRLAHAAGVSVAALRDAARRRRGRAPVLVPIAGELGSGAVIAGPGAEAALRMLVPEGVEWRNQVNAGVILQVLRDRPGLDAARIACPVFVAACAGDVITPEAPARAAAEAAPRGEFHGYAFRHFEAYVGAGRDRLIADELEFLRRHLLPTG